MWARGKHSLQRASISKHIFQYDKWLTPDLNTKWFRLQVSMQHKRRYRLATDTITSIPWTHTMITRQQVSRQYLSYKHIWMLKTRESTGRLNHSMSSKQLCWPTTVWNYEGEWNTTMYKTNAKLNSHIIGGQLDVGIQDCWTKRSTDMAACSEGGGTYHGRGSGEVTRHYLPEPFASIVQTE